MWRQGTQRGRKQRAQGIRIGAGWKQGAQPRARPDRRVPRIRLIQRLMLRIRAGDRERAGREQWVLEALCLTGVECHLKLKPSHKKVRGEESGVRS